MAELGLNCPDCGKRTEVSRTRRASGSIIRTRRCPGCKKQFPTREVFTSEEPIRRPAHAQGIVYEMMFLSRRANCTQLSRLCGMSYTRTYVALQKLVDDGRITQPRNGLYVLVEPKS